MNKKRILISQFLSFLGVGAVATAIHYLILIVLTEFAATNAVLASGVGYVLSSAVNYFLNYRITFRSSERHFEASIKFGLVAGSGLVFNLLIMFVLNQSIGIHYVLAQIVATSVVLIWNFFVNRYWTYRAPSKI